MDAYRQAGLPSAQDEKRHLTLLYSAAKRGAVISTPSHPDPHATATNADLQRKYRIQKDRLITWGLDWVDQSKGSDGNIDESVARAGVTEIVASVLRNINEVTNEAERLSGAGISAVDKAGRDAKLPIFDEARYEDLLKDLTVSIDNLYEISRSRRAIARGEYPGLTGPEVIKPKSATLPSTRKELVRSPSFASSELTLVNPAPFHRPLLSPYAGLPPRIDPSALQLSNEGPPPYVSIGVPTTTRLIGRLSRRRASESVQKTLGSGLPEVQVLVEYANFDSTYRATGVPPPLGRVENIAAALLPMRPESQHGLSLLGFFEDLEQPRVGLVYDLPYALQNRLQIQAPRAMAAPKMFSLHSLMQKAREANSGGHDLMPPLEDRFRLALHLTNQLRQLHHQDFTHGNVCSASIVFLGTQGESSTIKQKALTSCHWTAFDVFSKYNLDGLGRDMVLNLYQHIDDTAINQNTKLTDDIKYDLYSLGLVLYEVGQWAPLSTVYKSKYSPADFKKKIRKDYIPRLAARVGTTYMQAVSACVDIAEERVVTRQMLEDVYSTVLGAIEKCCSLASNTTGNPRQSDQEMAASTIFKTVAGHVDDLMTRIDILASCNDEISQARDWALTYQQTKEQADLDQAWKVFSIVQDRFYAQLTLPDPTADGDEQRIAATKEFTGHIKSRQAEDLTVARRALSLHNIPKVHDVKVSIQREVSDSASFREYKRKVTIIQRLWRQHRQLTHRTGRPDASHDQDNQRQIYDQIPRDRHEPDTIPVTSWGRDSESAGATPATRTHRSKPQRREFHLDLTPAMVQEWSQFVAPRLGRLCERVMGNCLESSSIDLTAYGESPETARPTFLVTCESATKVRELKAAIKRHFRYDHEKYQVVVKRDTIRRCRGRKGQRTGAARSMAVPDGGVDAQNPFYQEKPLCGASIGAYRDDEHLPPASFGGIVLVDGRPFGMSVHHMLEPEEASDDELDDGEVETSSVLSANDSDEESEGEPTIRPGYITSEKYSDTSSDTSSETSSDTSSDSSRGRDDSSVDSDNSPILRDENTPGIMPDGFDDITITQPALDDAIDLDLHVDEDEDSDSDSGIDEDHILSYKLGEVHASSGLKRTAFRGTQDGYKGISQSLPQEIDWCLFKLDPPRIHLQNTVKGGNRFRDGKRSSDRSSDDGYPCSVKDAIDLANAKVHCIGRTSGLSEGIISGTMQLVKMQGRHTYSASWAVQGEFGAGGDSGAWVISNEDGAVCGHVLAERAGKTYICPMELLLKDIRETLGADIVELPVSAGESVNELPPIASVASARQPVNLMAKTSGLQQRRGENAGGVRLSMGSLPSPPASPKAKHVDVRGSAAPTGHGQMVPVK